MKTTKELIEEKEALLESLRADLDTVEIDVDEHEEQYCEALDESGPVEICGMSFNPSRILQEMDLTAYRCGLLDYCDGLDVSETDEYKQIEEQIEAEEAELEDLEEQLAEEEDQEEA